MRPGRPPSLTALRNAALKPEPIDLTQRLRLETRDLHAQTERTGVMAELLAGRLALPAYCALLRSLHALYEAMEAGLLRADAHRAVQGLHSLPLQRSAALVADLNTLQGPLWRQQLPLCAAGAAYAARLQQLAEQGSAALVAHAYARYLGDLHGGQILKRLVARGLGPAADGATRFYEFGGEPQVLALRQRLRQALATLPVTAAEADLIVAEARWSFLQHQRLFTELAA